MIKKTNPKMKRKIRPKMIRRDQWVLIKKKKKQKFGMFYKLKIRFKNLCKGGIDHLVRKIFATSFKQICDESNVKKHLSC